MLDRPITPRHLIRVAAVVIVLSVLAHCALNATPHTRTFVEEPTQEHK